MHIVKPTKGVNFPLDISGAYGSMRRSHGRRTAPLTTRVMSRKREKALQLGPRVVGQGQEE